MWTYLLIGLAVVPSAVAGSASASRNSFGAELDQWVRDTSVWGVTLAGLFVVLCWPLVLSIALMVEREKL